MRKKQPPNPAITDCERLVHTSFAPQKSLGQDFCDFSNFVSAYSPCAALWCIPSPPQKNKTPTMGRVIFLAEYYFITNHRIQIPTFTGNLQGFFISYVAVRQICALHRMPSQGPHWPFCLLMTILHLGNMIE